MHRCVYIPCTCVCVPRTYLAAAKNLIAAAAAAASCVWTPVYIMCMWAIDVVIINAYASSIHHLSYTLSAHARVSTYVARDRDIRVCGIFKVQVGNVRPTNQPTNHACGC